MHIHAKEYHERIRSYYDRKHIAEIAWIAVGQCALIVFGFISTKFLTGMGPAEFGKYSLVLTVQAFLNLVWYGPFEQGFVRFYYDYSNKGKAKTFIDLLYSFLLWSGVLSFFIIFIVYWFIRGYIQNESLLFGISASCFIVVTLSVNPLFAFFNLLRKRKTNTIFQIFERVLSVSLLWLAYKYFSLNVTIALLMLIISSFIVLSGRISNLNKTIVSDTSESETNNVDRKEIMATLKKFILPFILWGFPAWLQLFSDRWVILNYLSTSEVGIYALMLTIGNVLIAIPHGILSQFIGPIIYEKYSHSTDIEKIQEGNHYITLFVACILVVLLISIIITACWGKQITLLISNDKFAEYWFLLPFICLGLGLFYLGQTLTTIGMVLKRPEKYIVPKISIGIISIAINVLAIRAMGIYGVVFALNTVGTFYLIYIYLINRNMLRFT